MSAIKVRPLREGDREWIGKMMYKQWRSEIVVSRGRVHYARDLPGFIAAGRDQEVGFDLCRIDSDACELVVIFGCVSDLGPVPTEPNEFGVIGGVLRTCAARPPAWSATSCMDDLNYTA